MDLKFLEFEQPIAELEAKLDERAAVAPSRTRRRNPPSRQGTASAPMSRAAACASSVDDSRAELREEKVQPSCSTPFEA